MIIKKPIFYILILFLINSCIAEYIPVTDEPAELLNVEGLITDQPGINTIKVSKTISIWTRHIAKPLKGCKVSISDDLGQIFNLKEINNGIYITDSSVFRGRVGRTYTLHIETTTDEVNYSYNSFPVEMKPVPPVDKIYYEKIQSESGPYPVEGCRIYIDTHDPSGICRFFRWEYAETWEFRIPYNVPNKICWISNNSSAIYIKNASHMPESRIVRFPVLTITDPVDRLSEKYSLLVSQYSMNDDEYLYWERLNNTLEQVGGLYDQVPAIIPNNIYCVEDPDRKILGYFSVSARTDKRIFIKDKFQGLDGRYKTCITDTITGNVIVDTISGINSFIWLIIDSSSLVPPKRYFTRKRGCADCLVRGTTTEPDFWNEDK